jgi:hypothetical protein
MKAYRENTKPCLWFSTWTLDGSLWLASRSDLFKAGKELPIPTEQRTRRAPDLVWMFLETRKPFFSSAGGRTLDRRANSVLSIDNVQCVKNVSAFYKNRNLTLLFTTVSHSDLPWSSLAHFASSCSDLVTYLLISLFHQYLNCKSGLHVFLLDSRHN